MVSQDGARKIFVMYVEGELADVVHGLEAGGEVKGESKEDSSVSGLSVWVILVPFTEKGHISCLHKECNSFPYLGDVKHSTGDI